jgi:hypothetical protein
MREFASEENRYLSKIIAEAEALDSIKDEAKRLVNLMKSFLDGSKIHHLAGTKQTYIEALIAYSKYVYRSETDKTMALNFEDIPITNRLKVFHKEVENGKKNNSNSSQKYLPWQEVLEVLEKIRFEASLETSKNGKYQKNVPCKPSKILTEICFARTFCTSSPITPACYSGAGAGANS